MTSTKNPTRMQRVIQSTKDINPPAPSMKCAVVYKRPGDPRLLLLPFYATAFAINGLVEYPEKELKRLQSEARAALNRSFDTIHSMAGIAEPTEGYPKWRLVSIFSLNKSYALWAER